ncbi:MULTISPECIES: ImmA/IrrE family metallo-endopeptidase [unclassified Paenibacillus]|uniref:ImmA/IrrE family metallo-endopeptidase n=1 Tax=unclassified Paenibacillus TaxID=185978 RepID=UPI0030F61705
MEHLETISFPIDPLEIIHKYKWGVITYSELARENSISIQTVAKACQSNDAYVTFDEESETYTIAYNDTVFSRNRIRFTLMHEIGHILLNHLIDFDETILTRNSLTADKYKILENETNHFARNVLAPVYAVKQLPTISENHVSSFFGLTPIAAKVRIQLLQQDWINKSLQSNLLITKFKAIIFDTLNMKICGSCYCKFSLPNSKYCPICGSKKLLKRGYRIMKYEGYSLDNNGKALICPRCNNEDIHAKGEYCPVCGLMLVNRCTGYKFIDSSYEDESVPCGTIVPGYARCCHICGCSTTYYESGILPAWDEKGSHSLPNHTSTSRLVIVPNRETKVVNSNVVEISDDDLPF